MTGRLLSVVAISVWLGGSPCLASDAARDSAPEVKDPLHDLGIEIGGEARAIAALEVVGLATIDDAQLWTMVEKPIPPFVFARAAALVEALDRSDAFARIEPRLRVTESGELTLVVRVTEHPRVTAVDLSGLEDVPASDLLPELLGMPIVPQDPAPPAPAVFARIEEGALRPGILRGGVATATTRLVKRLFVSGYLMVGVQGTLSADGRLTVEIDQGRLEEVQLVGAARRLWPAIQEALDLPPGRTFDQAELGDAVKRVERELPFLQPDSRPRPTRVLPAVETSADGHGGTHFTLREGRPADGPGVFSVEGRRLTIFFAPKFAARFRFSPDELLRHTPVGGIGIGIQSETKLWDPKDRVHLRFDTFAGTIDSAALETLDEEDPGGEFELALRCRIPPLRIADFSTDVHGLFDTADAWRTGRQTAYLNSLLFDRPDREYYWREGAAFSLTLQPIDRLLVGAEYRLDSYRSVPALAEPATFFNHDDRFVNPEIQEGEMGSVVLRAELRSEPVHPEQIRGLFRTPETSIVAQERSWGLRTGYHLLATVEIARPGLGSDERHPLHASRERRHALPRDRPRERPAPARPRGWRLGPAARRSRRPSAAGPRCAATSSRSSGAATGRGSARSSTATSGCRASSTSAPCVSRGAGPARTSARASSSTSTACL